MLSSLEARCRVLISILQDVLTSLSKVYNNQLQLTRRPPKYSPRNISVSVNRAKNQSTGPTRNHKDRNSEDIPMEDCDVESPQLKSLMEKTVTEILGEELDGNWVMVKDIQDNDWVMVERESK